jgi:hypothetical protein
VGRRGSEAGQAGEDELDVRLGGAVPTLHVEQQVSRRPRGVGWRAFCALGLAVVAFGGVPPAAWPLPAVATVPARVQARLRAHRGRYAPLKQIPQDLQAAIVATEDERFYVNPGVDIRALGRVAIADLKAGRIVQGGSTLTEELADVMLVRGDRTPLRRRATMVLALRIEREFSKAQILERYLNAVYLGHGAYGVSQAASVYFGRPVQGT